MWKFSRALVVAVTVAGTVGMASPVQAAEYTDLLDAADDKDDYDESTYDPFDFSLEPSFSFDTGRARITREAPCVNARQGEYSSSFEDGDGLEQRNPRVQFDPDRCTTNAADPDAQASGILENREMIYRHQRAQLDITMRVGIYKDLELRLNAPFVFTSTHGLKYANEAAEPDDRVDASNSSVDPDDSRIRRDAENTFESDDDRNDKLRKLNGFQTHRYFNLDGTFSDYTRAGFADPSIGIHWGPFNDQRDPTKATLNLGMDYVLPIAKIRSHENPEAVGEGLHKLKWNFRASKRFDWIDPYFGLEYNLQIPARGSPIKQLADIDDQNDGQTVTNAPHEGNITIGTEFVPHEDKEHHRKYAIDLRFSFGYVSEGRDYTPLFEHMTRSDCNGKSTRQILPEFDDDGDLTRKSDGTYGVGCSWVAQRPANVQPEPTYDVTNLENSDTFQTNGIMTVESYATFTGQLGFNLQPSEYFQLRALTALTHQQEHFMTNARTGQDGPDDNDKVGLTGDEAQLERNPAHNSTYDSPGTRFRINQYNIWSFMLTAAMQF